MAQLPYSERCLHKLQQNMNCYQDKLYNDEVYHNLVTISSRTKKFAKPEVKVCAMLYITPIQPHPIAAATGRVGGTMEEVT